MLAASLDIILVFSYDSHLSTSHFFGDVHVRVAPKINFFKYVYFKHVKRVLPESLERKYFSVHIAIFYKFAFHSCQFFSIFVNCVMVFFPFFLINKKFYNMQRFK